MPNISIFEKAIRLVLIAIAVVWSAFPVLLVVLSSFKDPREIFSVPPSLIFVPTLTNYEALAEEWPSFFSNLTTSLIVTLGATLFTIAVSASAAYVYSRYRSRFLTSTAFFMLFVRMIPPIIVTLPLFPVVNMLRLNDTPLILILLYSSFFVSLSTWITKTFIDAVPREIEEAAMMDGANTFRIVSQIVLPLAIPGIIASGVFVLVYSWNEYVFALIFTSRNAKTTPLVISEILGTVQGVDWGILFAAATIQLVPIVVLVIAAQRYIVAGLTSGGVKS
ncbi:MAG TPA: carbohydrate ABC transporter permease [Devosiaceae bacterium]|jgi:multiple sugar transport system permease protein